MKTSFAEPLVTRDSLAENATLERARTAAEKLFAYCRASDWSGYDPYDALNSKLFEALPFLDTKWPRLLFTQALKRSPINIRRLALIPKTQNPKGTALFLSAFLKLLRAGRGDDDSVGHMVECLKTQRSPDTRYWCWGYSFPWQTRGPLVPRGSPNLVCTTFAANALLDLHEQRRSPACLEMAVSAAEYILNELYWTAGSATAGLAYPLPSVRAQVHNANFLGAALFARVHRLTGDTRFLGPALRVARHSAGALRKDGSWAYGEDATQQWVDNFHTGYNLCALRTIAGALGTDEFEGCVERGFALYRASFFRKDGAVRYFQNETYPIDIHCIAQSIITLVTLRDLSDDRGSLVRAVLNWAMENMWDERGFFYYRVLRLGTIRTSYMRWSQAWMLLALTTLVSDLQPGRHYASEPSLSHPVALA